VCLGLHSLRDLSLDFETTSQSIRCIGERHCPRNRVLLAEKHRLAVAKIGTHRLAEWVEDEAKSKWKIRTNDQQIVRTNWIAERVWVC